MLLWVLLALMTGAAVLTVLWPLSRRVGALPDDEGDVRFYREQLAEIERDRQRGALGEDEAAAARAEAGRRLLRADASALHGSDPSSEPSLRRRRAASALALSVVPLVGLAVYGALGSPHLTSPTTVEAKADLDTQRAEFTSALEKIEAHLAAKPEDFKAWDVVAPIYFRMGRFADAAKAYRKARGLGDTPERLMGEGEALVIAGKGMVSEDAKAVFRRGIEMDPASARARFYLALADEQGGEVDKAAAAYRALLAGAPPDAPWTGMVQARLERLAAGGPSPEQVASVPPESVSPDMIEGMVGRLDARLKEKGGSEGEWSRLVRSFAMLGRREDALDRLARAREALASQPDALARLEQGAAQLGLTAQASRR